MSQEVNSNHPLLLEADEPPVADDHVVQEVDAEDLSGLGGVLRELNVLGTWPRVPAWMETAMLAVAKLIAGVTLPLLQP